MAKTYEPIATTTLTTPTASISFSSISSSYTDLILIATLKAQTAGSDVYLRVNGDSGANYHRLVLWGNGTSVGANRVANQAQIRLNYTVDVPTTDGTILITNFNSYSRTTHWKPIVSKLGLASDAIDQSIGIWRNDSAINSIALTLTSSNWDTGTTATLYGITAA